MLLIILSGKRKCGKDYVADEIRSRLGSDVQIGRLSAPLKAGYAVENGINYAELLTAGPFKEKHRKKMIIWGENRRKCDPGCFARQVIAKAEKNSSFSPILIISDARRETDLEFLLSEAEGKQYDVLLVRIQASNSVRQQRGWVFTHGVDDKPSECGLDKIPFRSEIKSKLQEEKNEKITKFAWDFCIRNNNDSKVFDSDLTELLKKVKTIINK
eukprot:g5975.t1